MKITKKQKYFIAAGVLIVVAIVAVVGGISFKKYQDQQQQIKIEQAQQAAKEAAEKEEASKKNLTPEQAAQKVQDMAKEQNGGRDEYFNDTSKNELTEILNQAVEKIKTPQKLSNGATYTPPDKVLFDITYVNKSTQKVGFALSNTDDKQYLDAEYIYADNLYRRVWHLDGHVGYKQTVYMFSLDYPTTPDLS